MNILVLLGSPRKNGNTESLANIVWEELFMCGHICRSVRLYDKKISPCLACRGCQKDHTGFGCLQKDDMEEIAELVFWADLILLASPIYSWYCTPPVKSVLDRLVYGMNKYYGEEKGPSLWRGKHLGLITTCGYPAHKGADLWEEGMRRYCKHSGLMYDGMLCERHMGYDIPFMDKEKEENARDFARTLCQRGEK